MEASPTSFRIGVISRLTGLSADTIRMWERRYGAVTPSRTAGQDRLYSQGDLARLSLLKQLVDRGHAISTVANMAEPDLRARLSLHEGGAVAPARAPLTELEVCRIALVGDALVETLGAELKANPGMEMVGQFPDINGLKTQHFTRAPDVLVFEIAAVHPETADRVREAQQACGAGSAIVVYTFATQAALKRLSNQGVMVLRAPVSAKDIACACRSGLQAPAAGNVLETNLTPTIPARLFSNQALARIQNATSSLACECPNHLADLINRLVAFEQYSADCENRNEQDAKTHAELHRVTALARRMIEDALQQVIEADGLEILNS